MILCHANPNPNPSITYPCHLAYWKQLRHSPNFARVSNPGDMFDVDIYVYVQHRTDVYQPAIVWTVNCSCTENVCSHTYCNAKGSVEYSHEGRNLCRCIQYIVESTLSLLLPHCGMKGERTPALLLLQS